MAVTISNQAKQLLIVQLNDGEVVCLAPGEKCVVKMPEPGTLSSALSSIAVSSEMRPDSAWRYASTMTGNLMRLAVGIGRAAS